MGIPENWRMNDQRLRLTGTEYGCGHISLAKHGVCPVCLDAKNQEDEGKRKSDSDSSSEVVAKISHAVLVAVGR